jgi:hypothetical protein
MGELYIYTEVEFLAENQSFSIADSVAAARTRLAEELHAQAEQIQKLNSELTELQRLHERTGLEIGRQWDAVHTAAVTAAAAMVPKITAGMVLDRIVGSVKALMDCASPEQVTQTLSAHAAQWGVRAAIFDVRGKSVWGSHSHGFGSGVTDGAVRSIVIQLTQDNPFRQLCDTAAEVLTNAEALKKNRNVTEKLKPGPDAPIVLLPIRSAGTVTAILYADPAESGGVLPVNALKILAEFAGAQIDRLIALSGGLAEGVASDAVKSAESDTLTTVVGEVGQPAEDVAETAPHIIAEENHPQEPANTETHPPEHVSDEIAGREVEAGVLKASTNADAHTEVSSSAENEQAVAAPEPGLEHVAHGEEVDHAAPESSVNRPWKASGTPDESTQEFPVPNEATETQALPLTDELKHEAAEIAPAEIEQELVVPVAAQEVDTPNHQVDSIQFAGVAEVPPQAPPATEHSAEMGEVEQKAQKDARRFAKLLVSEIELYNKAKVAEGRENRDLYKRLRSDIDRSRLTFEKRFGKGGSQPVDYFHDELVKILAENDSARLGPEYPGPSM